MAFIELDWGHQRAPQPPWQTVPAAPDITRHDDPQIYSCEFAVVEKKRILCGFGCVSGYARSAVMYLPNRSEKIYWLLWRKASRFLPKKYTTTLLLAFKKASKYLKISFFST